MICSVGGVDTSNCRLLVSGSFLGFSIICTELCCCGGVLGGDPALTVASFTFDRFFSVKFSLRAVRFNTVPGAS